jgi:hypothetical protein
MEYLELAEFSNYGTNCFRRRLHWGEAKMLTITISLGSEEDLLVIDLFDMSQSQRQGRENASSRLSRKWTSMAVPISLRGVPLKIKVSLRGSKDKVTLLILG